MTDGRPTRFPYGLYGLLLALILLFTLAPVVGVFVASGLAEANGCMLNEATTHPCVILGMDWGGALYTLFVLGWFALATLPLGGGALVVWLVLLIIHRIAWGRMQKATP